MRARGILIAAIVAGASYVVADDLGVGGAALIAWKGAGVALLALWAAMQARGRDGGMIAAVMALGALGDMLIEWRLAAGAAAFALGHIVAILLYSRNRRGKLSGSQMLLGLLVAPVTAFAAWMLTLGQPGGLGVVVYAVLLGMMAAAAWVSRFPRYRTGVGAMLFVASDLLIFARMGPLKASALPGLLIWPLYFAGQALIAYGVVRTLSTDARVSTP